MKKQKVIIYSLLALTTLTTAVSCSGEKQSDTTAMANAPQSYPVVEVEEKTLTGYIEYPANITGRVNNNVRAKIQGYITRVLVDEGQYVQKGQPLFTLETNSTTETALAAKAAVDAAKAVVNSAQIEVNRLAPLVQKGIIGEVQLSTARAKLLQAQAQHKQAIASYKSSQAMVDYSIIRAPISGVVGKINFREGSLVGPTDATAITTVSDTSELYVYFSMNEKEYLNFLKDTEGATLPEKLRNIPSVDLIMANGESYSEKGRIQTVTGQIDAATGTIQFRVLFNNANKILSNGNSGRVRIPKMYDKVAVIPESATYEQQGFVYAYKVDKNNIVNNTKISVTSRIDNMIIVEDGLKKGDKIVAQGVATLKPETKIAPQQVKLDSLLKAIKPIF